MKYYTSNLYFAKQGNCQRATSPPFPSNDLSDVMPVCLRSHYSSVIDHNDKVQWLHMTSGAWESEGEKGRVEKPDAQVLKSYTLFLTRKSKGHSLFLSGNSFAIFLLKERKNHFFSERMNNGLCFFALLVNTCLQNRAGHKCMPARLSVSAVLFSTKPFLAFKLKRTSADKPNRQVLAYPTAKKDLSKWNWEQKERRRVFCGFTKIMA